MDEREAKLLVERIVRESADAASRVQARAEHLGNGVYKVVVESFDPYVRMDFHGSYQWQQFGHCFGQAGAAPHVYPLRSWLLDAVQDLEEVARLLPVDGGSHKIEDARCILRGVMASLRQLGGLSGGDALRGPAALRSYARRFGGASDARHEGDDDVLQDSHA